MHRFYLSPNDWASACLTGSESHHAQDVLRLETGDRLVIFDGCGREATAEISAADGGTVHLRVLQEALTPKLPARLSLAQAIPKGKNMELIVQKAVEIGAAEVFPLLSSRSVVQLDADSAVQRQCKWHNVAIEAAKQCGQNWLPQVHLPGSPENFFSRLETNFDLQLIGSLQPGAMHLKKVLADYADTHNGGRPASVLMVIGPEGDFTPAEIALARSHGCTPITLGPIILRVETAAIYCLSILSYELLGSR